jgi:hypothetical protein
MSRRVITQLICAWFNLIIGLVSLLLVTRSELGDRLFYEGPKGDEEGLWLIGLP